jgi:hypothetical protein
MSGGGCLQPGKCGKAARHERKADALTHKFHEIVLYIGGTLVDSSRPISEVQSRTT